MSKVTSRGQVLDLDISSQRVLAMDVLMESGNIIYSVMDHREVGNIIFVWPAKHSGT